jgi:hypothetical protein
VHNGDCASSLQDPHYFPCLADEVNGFAGSDYPELLQEPRNLTTALLPLHTTVWAPALLTSEGIGHVDMGSE